MKVDINTKLGLYEVIDEGFDEWLCHDNFLKLYFITADAEIFSKKKYGQHIDRAESVSLPKLTLLLQKFNDSRNDKEALKSIYFDFIDGICKPPDRRIAPVNEDRKDGAYSEKDEYKAALKQEETQNIFEDEIDDFEEKSEKLEGLTQKAELSDIEKYALDYIKDRKNKHLLLNHFTHNGIIQIANRAAYKVYYLSRYS